MWIKMQNICNFRTSNVAEFICVWKNKPQLENIFKLCFALHGLNIQLDIHIFIYLYPYIHLFISICPYPYIHGYYCGRVEVDECLIKTLLFYTKVANELSLCNKLWFSNTYIFSTWWCKPLIFQTWFFFHLTEFIVWNI